MAILQATDENFDELKKEGVSIVDFYSTHCGPCRLLLPTLLKIESELPFVNLIKVNTDDCPKLAAEYRISAVPTVYLARDGKMNEFSNCFDEEAVRQQLGILLYE